MLVRAKAKMVFERVSISSSASTSGLHKAQASNAGRTRDAKMTAEGDITRNEVKRRTQKVKSKPMAYGTLLN